MRGNRMHRPWAKVTNTATSAPRRVRSALCLCTPLVASAAALIAAGCSGGSDSVSLPKMPDLSVAAITPAAYEKPVGSPTEIYARVARGANSCWFGGSGPLKKDYIYHAEADAPSRGGKAKIEIHVRDPSQPNPRGPKAFRINIDPEPDGTSAALKVENLRMPEPMANGMTADVHRWAKGDQGCAGSSTVAGWGAEPPPPEPVAAPAKPKSKAAAKSAASVKAKPKAP
ncbi:MAG: hypothetical protein WBP38_04930 [Hyphomicrobium sp.]